MTTRDAVAAVAAQMKSGKAAQVCAQAARTLAAALAGERDSYARTSLADGLITVTAGMEPGEAKRILTDVLAKTTDSYAHSRLAKGLAAVRLEPGEAAQVCSQAARTLSAALDEEKDSYAQLSLTEGLVAVAARMEPGETARVLTDTLTKTTDSICSGVLITDWQVSKAI